MSLLDNASLLLTPNAYKASKLYSVIPSNGNGDFTATRATTATRINSSGLVESVALNMPRLDYSLGSCPNILLEPQRTNLALQSSSFDNASWVKLGSTITANSTTSPSGVVNADTITRDGTSQFNPLTQAIAVTTGTTYTLSVYAKKGTNNFIQIFAATALFTSNFFANFDLNTGVVGSVGSAATASIQDVGNGWYRCTITGAAISTGAANAFSISLVTSSTAPRGQSNTLTTSVFLWGAQLEAGAYATSFIPTTTASVTRNFDYIIRNNLVTNGIVSATQGTWFIEIRNNLPFTRDNSVSCLNFGMDGNNCIRFRHSGSGRISVEKNVGGVLTTLVTGLSTTQTMKIAFKWNGSEVETFMNGVQQTPANKTYPSTIIPQTVTTNFTNTNFGVPMTINEMAFFPNQLTDSQLIALTT